MSLLSHDFRNLFEYYLYEPKIRLQMRLNVYKNMRVPEMPECLDQESAKERVKISCMEICQEIAREGSFAMRKLSAVETVDLCDKWAKRYDFYDIYFEKNGKPRGIK